MTVVAMIPARGGSKRVPRKNLAPCAGKPLLAWTAEAALQSRLVDHALLSTDDAELAEAGRGLGLEVPFLRPPELSADATPMAPVMQHALDWSEQSYGPITAFLLLQPTSPLRESRHIDEALELFLNGAAESLVSVIEISHIHHPLVAYRIADGCLAPYIAGQSPEGAPPAYSRNGPAILINRPAVIRRGERWGETILPYIMAEEDSVDIDTPLDLAFAEFLLQRRAAAASAPKEAAS